jgi:methionyl-tRNA formyltransferase
MSNVKIKIIFFGTPEFGLPSLEKISNDIRFEIMAIVTQPDKQVGRKQIITPPPVKLWALKNKIQVFQPEKIITLSDKIKEFKPDAIIVIAYSQIIPEKILLIPKYGCINIHGSLLPKYRGASCIQAPILNGDKETGITIMKMDKGLDTGPILKQKILNISEEETSESLSHKLSLLGSEILIPVLLEYFEGKIIIKNQDEKKASYVKIIKKNDGRINWLKSNFEIERLIRAMLPWPVAHSLIANDEFIQLKIFKAENLVIDKCDLKSGQIFLHNNNLAVKCGKDALIIKKLQLAGKKEISGQEFINGYKNLIGKILN